MLLWLAFAVMALVAVGFVTVPLLRRHARDESPARVDYDLAVYKDQLREIERDRARGVLDEEQAAAARLEVERRLLAAAAASAPPPGRPEAAPASGSANRPWHLAVIVALILVPAAALVYLHQGAPWLPDTERAARQQDQDSLRQFAELIAQLEQRLADNPDELRGWALLARGYARLGRLDAAQDAQRRAMALATSDPEAAEIAAAFAQILVEQAQGTVTPAARAALAEALARNPKQPQARYLTGLAKLQEGDAAGALADWQALLAETPPEAPWREGLAQQIASLQAESAAPADPAARQAMIESMVAGLAARLEAARAEGGGTAEEWARLARSYRVLGRLEAAREAYGEAVKRAPDDVALLREHAAVTGEAAGETSEDYRAALTALRDRLPTGSAERAAVEERLKTF